MSSEIPFLDNLITRIENTLRRLEEMEQRWTNRSEYHRLEEWLTPEQVMDTLILSPRTLQTLRDKHLLHPSRLGGKFYYSRREIEEILEDEYKRSVMNHAKRG